MAGMDCQQHSLEVRSKIGYLPENVPLYLDMTTRRFLAFAAAAKGISGSRSGQEIERVMDVCTLTSVAERLIGQIERRAEGIVIAFRIRHAPQIIGIKEQSLAWPPIGIAVLDIDACNGVFALS